MFLIIFKNMRANSFIKQLKVNGLNNIFFRNYYRSVKIPASLIFQVQKTYLNEFLPKVPSGNFNPSFYESLILKEKIARFFRANSDDLDCKNFISKISEFVIDDQNDQSKQVLTVLELVGLNQVDNLSLVQDIYFKTLTLSAIMEIFDIKRSVHNDFPAIGFLVDNNQFIPHHCDKMHQDKIPEIVAILTIRSNSNAITFFTENDLIYNKFKSLYPQSFKILEEVNISKNEVDENGYFQKTKAHKVINYHENGNVFLHYNFSNNPYLIDDIKNCQYTQDQVDKAIDDFKIICKNSKECFRFICDKKNNVLLFKNKHVLHGRSAVLGNVERKMVYLPFDYSIKLIKESKREIDDKKGFEDKKFEDKKEELIDQKKLPIEASKKDDDKEQKISDKILNGKAIFKPKSQKLNKKNHNSISIIDI
jgi:hypothetical protein